MQRIEPIGVVVRPRDPSLHSVRVVILAVAKPGFDVGDVCQRLVPKPTAIQIPVERLEFGIGRDVLGAADLLRDLEVDRLIIDQEDLPFTTLIPRSAAAVAAAVARAFRMAATRPTSAGPTLRRSAQGRLRSPGPAHPASPAPA